MSLRTQANLVLQNTIERIFAANLYADVHRGIYIVRGENVLMLGEIDLDKDDYVPEPYEEAPIETVHATQRKEQENRKTKDKAKREKLLTMGFEPEHSGEGAGIARILASPSHGNLAVALLARRPDPLQHLTASLRASTPGSTIEAFPSDTTPASLDRAFSAIASHAAFANLPLVLAIYSVKHSSKKPFLDETHADFTASLTTYVGGAFAFAQLAVRRFLRDHGEEPLGGGGGGGQDGGSLNAKEKKKGTLIFTGTLGALRCSAQFAAYGAGRAGVRQLAQSLARELSPLGIHVVHTIANGGIRDEMGEGREEGEEEKKAVVEGKRMSAESVGRAYLWLHEQGVDLWTHELDLRPAQEKF
ncbi:MAG: hypothetical protein Q9165_008691 [Trypethelium subeluteriae]